LLDILIEQQKEGGQQQFPHINQEIKQYFPSVMAKCSGKLYIVGVYAFIKDLRLLVNLLIQLKRKYGTGTSLGLNDSAILAYI